MTDLSRISHAVIYKTAGNIIVISLGFLVSIILNRYYGKETYGLLIMVFTVTGLFYSISGLGIPNAFNRYIPQLENSNSTDIGNFVKVGSIFFIASHIFFASILYLLSDIVANYFFHRPELSLLLQVGAVYFIGISTVEFIFQIFQSLQSWKIECILNVTYYSLYFTLVIMSIYLLNVGLTGILLANTIASGITVASGYLLLPESIKKDIHKSKVSISELKEKGKTILTFGIPFVLGNLQFYFVTWFDKGLLGRYSKPEDLTFYYIAFTFLNAFIILFKITSTVLMPYLSGISKLDKNLLKEKYRLIFRWFFIISISFSILMFFYVSPLIPFVYGADYLSAGTTFQWLQILFILRTFQIPSYMFIVNVFGKVRKEFVNGTVLVLANILLDILLIPIYGIHGAIAASIFAYLILFIFVLIYIKEIREMIPYDFIIKNVFLLFLIIIAYLFINSTLRTNIFTGLFIFITYFILLHLLNAIDAMDIKMLKNIFYTLKGNFTLAR